MLLFPFSFSAAGTADARPGMQTRNWNQRCFAGGELWLLSATAWSFLAHASFCSAGCSQVIGSGLAER